MGRARSSRSFYPGLVAAGLAVAVVSVAPARADELPWIGLAPAIRIRSTHLVSVYTNDNPTGTHTSSNFAAHTRILDLGMVVAFGLEIGHKRRLRVETRTTDGLVDAFPGHAAGANQTWALLVGVNWGP